MNGFGLDFDTVLRMSEAAAKVGVCFQEMIDALAAAAGYFFVAVTPFIIDENLRKVATGKEWHLMINAKKHRTRKKYRNRLIKRYYNKIKTEERNNEKNTTNY